MEFNIRKNFCSRFGSEGLLAEFDFSQLEVAALAEISNDAILLDEVNNGIDIHRENAALWLRCDPKYVSNAQRKKAKIMTFQLQYGAGPAKMAESLKISKIDARNFIDTFYLKYSGIERFHSMLKGIRDRHQSLLDLQTIGQDRYKVTLTEFSPTGRVYTIPARFDTNKSRWYISLTEMKNYPVQGFATADVVPFIINRINLQLHSISTEAKLINTVHDSFVIDSTEEAFIDVLKLVENVFSNFPEDFYNSFDYKLKAVYNYDVKFGWNLSEEDMKKLTREEVQAL